MIRIADVIPNIKTMATAPKREKPIKLNKSSDIMRYI